ncbi:MULTISPECIES: hypothetical protein [unclassified Pseudomonas]|uniref:hypothetical protein n=1 Tax=unclassified Pseudomonas TaxID=196821 RepID=UPI001F2C2928|nr:MULTISPECIES: hypothetical protein [unclassified Pseudomonas]MCF5228574.1 hypothetical protein [Pseudomonas sp. PA-5-4H]MCF5236225.1 hypothetical protein [Pseudomonas sp. PA-5-4G]MCF5247433.1 hypothetical protein [Pseudomonas sp. PA-5-4B]MCF5253583.1 hypothetical protein [Pseudomonas sp. PA-5-4B]MCF5262771.1 hypothetical protein [Pseudomonas sp. PA-5-4A]
MAKDNAQIQRDKRSKEKALLERIGAEKRTLIVSKALDDALQVLGARHDFEEWQETLSTFLINLAAATAEESARFANMSRPAFEISVKQSRQLLDFRKTGPESVNPSE